jgi:hypothetical protein
MRIQVHYASGAVYGLGDDHQGVVAEIESVNTSFQTSRIDLHFEFDGPASGQDLNLDKDKAPKIESALMQLTQDEAIRLASELLALALNHNSGKRVVQLSSAE